MSGSCWSRAYSFDAVSQTGYLAAKTSTIPVGFRRGADLLPHPALMAMTAGLDYVSDGRFQLGLGTSGPQVVEGFHGVPFDAPRAVRGRWWDLPEGVAAKLVLRREELPDPPLPADRGTGLGKPLKDHQRTGARTHSDPHRRAGAEGSAAHRRDRPGLAAGVLQSGEGR